jgi:hypothetical protein
LTRRSRRDTISAVWSAPESRVLVPSVALAAAWLSHDGTLLGVGVPRLGTALQALQWVLLFAVLATWYGSAALDDGRSVRRVVRRLGVALLLALGSARLARRLFSPILSPAGWSAYHYVRLLLPLALAGLWCALLLPRETRARLRAAFDDRSVSPLPSLIVLLVAAATLVSCSDLAFQLVRQGSAVQNRLAVDVIQFHAWLTTTAVVFIVLALVFVATASTVTSLLLVAPIFATMVFATLMKIRYMHSAVQPLDVLKLPEFMPLFTDFFGVGGAVGSVVAIGVWLVALVVVYRRTREPIPVRRRATIGCVCAVLLLAIVIAFLPPRILPAPLDTQGERLHAAVTALGTPRGEHREMARAGGIVLNFMSELQTGFVVTPRGHSAAAAAEVMRRYAERARPVVAPQPGHVNLIVYLVESLMDPDDFGLRFTSDPMPHLRALIREGSGGYAIVPGTFEGSANAEFEVLTGMSMSFLPDGSVAYRQYVRGPLPSLPRTLRELGYAVVAVQAGPKHYYDRERVYPLLGFDRTVWLHGAPGVPQGERGAWPTDDAVVDAVFDVSAARRPFFVFAFPASSHAPYSFGAYRNSTLDVVGAPTPQSAAELKEYVNAVRVADEAIGRLVEHFRRRRDSTIVVVLGDHFPPLTDDAFQMLSDRLAARSPVERALARRRVPLLVWANFALPAEHPTLSLNMLAPFLLERMGLPRSALFAVTDSLRRATPVASGVVQSQDGRLWARDSVPAPVRRLLDDYSLVQYELLFGRHSVPRGTDVLTR